MLVGRKLGHVSGGNGDEENKVHKKEGDERWMRTDVDPNLEFPLAAYS